MKLKTSQEHWRNPHLPASFDTADSKVNHSIEIEVNASLDNGFLSAACILASLAEAEGCHQYYEDPTVSNLAIALTSVVDALENLNQNDGIIGHVDVLKTSLSDVETAAGKLTDFIQCFKERIEEVESIDLGEIDGLTVVPMTKDADFGQIEKAISS